MSLAWQGPLRSLIAVALWLTPLVARSGEEVFPQGEARPPADEHRPWRASADGALALGPTSSLTQPGSVGPTGGILGRLRLRVSDRYALAVTGGLFGTNSPRQEKFAKESWSADLGLELRRSHALNLGGTSWRTVEAYLSVPVGITTVHLDRHPHRALVERVETHPEPYLGLAAGIQFAASNIGFLGEVRYTVHPVHYSDTVTPTDGSQPPLVEKADSLGHQVLFMLGGAVGL